MLNCSSAFSEREMAFYSDRKAGPQRAGVLSSLGRVAKSFRLLPEKDENRREMRLQIIRPTTLALLLCAVCAAQSGTSLGSTKSDPAAYLNRAIDEIQEHALRGNTAD